MATSTADPATDRPMFQTNRPRTALIANPYSSGLSSRKEKELVTDLREYLDLDVLRTQRPGHATDLAREAAERGVEVIIAAGGDGTANEVLNGLNIVEDGADDLPLFCHLPAGATNIVARSLGLPNDVNKATRPLLSAILSGRHRLISVASLNERFFLFAAGVGLDGAVVRHKETSRSGRRASDLSYISGVVRYLAENRGVLRERLEVTVDGSDESFSAASVLCSNTDTYTYLGRLPIRLTPQASWEGGLSFIAPSRIGMARLTKYGGKALGLGRKPSTDDDILRLHNDVTGLTIVADEPQPCQADGEYLGDFTKIRFAVASRALRLVG